MFAKAVLLVAAGMFGGFGVWLALDPGRLDAWLGIAGSGPEGRTELRAFYGGLEVGLAAFLVLCAFRGRWTGAGLAAVAAIHCGIAAARILGFAADGSLSGKLLVFLAVELGFAVLATLALLRLPSAPLRSGSRSSR